MSTTNQIADALEKSGIPFVRVEGVADGTEYWGLTVFHENVHAEVRECADWVEMRVWHYTSEQFMNMLVGAGTCHDLAETPSYRDKTEFKCSECGYEYSAVGGFGCEYGDEPDFNFCPNCGRRCINAREGW